MALESSLSSFLFFPPDLDELVTKPEQLSFGASGEVRATQTWPLSGPSPTSITTSKTQASHLSIQAIAWLPALLSPESLLLCENHLFHTLLVGIHVASSISTCKPIQGEGLIVLCTGQPQTKWLPIALKINGKK